MTTYDEILASMGLCVRNGQLWQLSADEPPPATEYPPPSESRQEFEQYWEEAYYSENPPPNPIEQRLELLREQLRRRREYLAATQAKPNIMARTQIPNRGRNIRKMHMQL